ncbi:MAG: arsenosugar biosynthesis radical SAM protein ArsS [Myxococcota bacterium]|nr:arsenosugar biosynthesis radical SAM protein ArsS [Myxococcota bacterium]
MSKNRHSPNPIPSRLTCAMILAPSSDLPDGALSITKENVLQPPLPAAPNGARWDFSARVDQSLDGPLRRQSLRTLQVNIGLRCNLACHHCHVESGPKRTERLSARDCHRLIKLLSASPGIETLDITGGAPELHENFRELVEAARKLEKRVIDRCNLTVFDEPGQEDTPEFLAQHGVEIVASLPCYESENVEQQRGRGVYDRSIAALLRLNELGYGQGNPERRLVLVYNPNGPSLPPDQTALKEEYQAALGERFGLTFDHLISLTNMPLKRFRHELERDGQYSDYMDLLMENFNPQTLPHLMCRSLISVDYRGRIFDCDFNQAIDCPPPRPLRTIWEIEEFDTFENREISTGSHCFGCTAGAGSSCGGTLT